MLVGGDLGILCLVLAVVLFVPVIGFVVRRKWRLAVARKEEIKRLLVLASEEAARAELEASTGFVASTVSFSGQLQYHCAVCFCPTSTRCARCKAVRYCSGKCQIIHWRQGHKEECRPFTAAHEISDVGGSSSQEAFNQDEYRVYAKPVQEFPEKPALSNSNCSPEVVSGKDGIRVEYLAAEGTISASKITSRPSSVGVSACTTSSESSVDVAVSKLNTSQHAERLDGQYSSNIITNKLETASANNGQSKPESSECFTLSNSVDSYNSARKLNEIKADCSDANARSGSTNSSGWSIDGLNESSFSEPSTPSSGFWEGTINSAKSKCDLLDDSAQSSFSEAGDGNISNFQSSPHLSFVSARDVGPDTSPSSLGIRKPIDEAENFLKPKSPPLLASEVSSRMDAGNMINSNISKSGENRYFSSSASYVHPASSIGEHSTLTSAPNICSMPSLHSEKVHPMVSGMGSTLHVLKSKKVGSLSSKASDAESARYGKVDSDAVSASSSQFSSCSSNAGNGLKTSMWKVVDQLKPSKLSRHYPLGIGSEISGRYHNKVLLPYEMFVKLYNWDKAELHPCGLINCGNSCYANAVLQCLAFTPPLTAYLLQGIHSKACEKKGWCFTCEFENLIIKAKEGNSPLSPIRILTNIQNIGSHLGNGREEDAHEFLRYAIDTMQSVCLKEAGVNASGSLEEETTLIGHTFGGYLRSKIKCVKCGGKSEHQEKMMDLTVEIEGDIGTLEEALRQFTGTEILDGANKYHCSRCKSYEKAKKKLTVLEAPNVLTIALKRFQSGKFGKLNKAIRFPETLNLAPYMSGTSDKSPIYSLYGVVVHLDVMNATFSGHYICYVKNIQNKWFKIDDSTVQAVELERVLTKGAYMLLYARYSPRAPRVVRNSVAPRDPRKAKTPTFKPRSQPQVSMPDRLNVHANAEPFYTNHVNFLHTRMHFEEDSSSDNSSNFGFSEEGSSSTESTRGSTSADDFLDQIFGDFGQNWNSHWRNLSDSDTSSSSSSPSPLYSRHSPLADLDRHTSMYLETGGLHIDNTESAVERNGLRARLSGRINKPEDCEVKGSSNFWYSDTTKQSRKSVSSSSCRQADSEKPGRVSPSGVLFRKSMKGRAG